MITRIAVLLAAALVLSACQSSSNTGGEPMCLKRKPGTIVTANEYCAVVLADPVDPSLVAEWKSQKVGFCCKACMPKWEKMTEAQKDATLAAAIAKGPIKD